MTGNPPHDPLIPGPPRPDDTDFEALARYFAGESSEAEAASVREWLTANPAEAARLAAIEEGVQAVAANVRGRVAGTIDANIDVERALRRVRAATGRGARMPASWTRRAPFLAAATVAAIALGTLVWRTRTGAGPVPAAPAARELATGVGQRDSLILADGSRILLGPLSRVIIPVANDRRVELRGEALFDVRHDDAHPFVVHAGRVVIRDVGTTFTVEASDSSNVRVVVTSGSVQLASDSAARGVLLNAGDVGRIRAGGAPTVEAKRATDDDVAWTRGQLAFKNAPMTVVRDELRRWYGIELVIADSSLRARTLNTTFVRETPEQAMQIIELMLGVRVEMRGDSAIVHRATGGSAPPRR
jgi:transmembrane sensor